MTYVYNDPAGFQGRRPARLRPGYRDYVDRVEGASGFVRAGGPLDGKVSLVIGGGSGHYPSYFGCDRDRVRRRGGARRPVRLAVGGAGLPDLPGCERRCRDHPRFRQLRRRSAQLQGGRRPADRRGHRHPDRLRDRRHRLGVARGEGQAAGHRRHLHGLQAGRCRGRGGGRSRRGRARDAGGQRRHVLVRGGLRRLHHARRRRAAVHRRRGEDGLRARDPRRARDQHRALDVGAGVGGQAGRDRGRRAARRAPPVGPRSYSTVWAPPSGRNSSRCTGTLPRPWRQRGSRSSRPRWARW